MHELLSLIVSDFGAAHGMNFDDYYGRVRYLSDAFQDESPQENTGTNQFGDITY